MGLARGGRGSRRAARRDGPAAAGQERAHRRQGRRQLRRSARSPATPASTASAPAGASCPSSVAQVRPRARRRCASTSWRAPLFGGRIDGARHACSCGRSAPASRCSRRSSTLKLDLRDIDLATLAGSAGRRRAAVASRRRRAGRSTPSPRSVTIPAGTPVTLLGDDYALGPVEVALETDKRPDARRSSAAPHAQRRRRASTSTARSRSPTRISISTWCSTSCRSAGLPGVADVRRPGERLRQRQAARRRAARSPRAGRRRRPGAGDGARREARRRAPGADADARRPGARRPASRFTAGLFDRFDVDAQAALAPKGPTRPRPRSTSAASSSRRWRPSWWRSATARHRQRPGQPSTSSPAQPLALDVLLPELWLSVARAVEGANGETTMQRVRVEAARPLHVSVDGDASCSTRRTSRPTAATCGVARAARRQARSRAALSGHLDLELLQPFLGAAARRAADRRPARRAGRRAARWTSPICAARWRSPTPSACARKDFDRDVVIGSGTVRARPRAASRVQNLAVTVDGSTMKLGGRATLGPGLRAREHPGRRRRRRQRAPARVRRARRGLRRAGQGARAGAAARDAAQARDARPPRSRHDRLPPARSSAREVQVQSGIVEISNDGVILHNVRVRPGRPGASWSSARRACAPGASQFTSLVPFKPGEFDLPLHGERLDLPQPRRRSRSTTWRSTST